jgi:general secretion pathway protein D
LKLDQVPLSEVLRYITEFTKTSYVTDDFSVIIRPLGSTGDEMLSRTYRVPPDFLSSLNTSEGEGVAAADPFAETQSGGGLLARRMGVQEALIASGINFPNGASAHLNASSNVLQVTNTPLNQDMIRQLVESIAQTEPVSVAVRVTMIRVQQTTLEELGYDWLLDDFKLSGSGGNDLTLAGGTQGNGGDLSDITLATGTVNRNPITAGNRSGDGAISGDTIDGILSNTTGGPQNNFRAPGILGVNGYLNNTTVQMLMRGLNQKKGVDLMIHPSTVTRSGQTSTIRVVRDFIYPTEYEPPEIPQQVGFSSGGSTPVTPANPTAFESREVGLIMEVLPVADANRQFIDLKIQPELVDLVGFVNYGSPINSSSLTGDDTPITLTDNAILMPVFSTQRLNTQVTIADGATLVLGGLMEQRMEKVEDKTPIFGSIPIVGRLFQSDASQTVSTAIIFLVNVELLDPTGRPYRSR